MFGSRLFAVTAPVGWVLVALAAYVLVAIPLVFWGLGRVHKRGLAWFVLPVLSAITTTLLWLYVNQQVYR